MCLWMIGCICVIVLFFFFIEFWFFFFLLFISFFFFFFFSSRRRHTRYIGDWSSDMCSSDLHIFRERHGVEIPRQQMVQWIEHIAGWLKPIYEAMWQEMKAGNYLQIDETPVKVLDRDVSGKTARGYLWFYAVPREDVILEFCSSRGQEAPNKRLQGFQGTIQTDAYEVYEAVVKKNPKIVRIGCLAHARRYFYKALQESLGEAVWFIGKIRELYRIEYAARWVYHTERHALRQVQAPPLWAVLQARAEELRPKLLPQSTMGKAVNYFLNEYKALECYLRDGRFEIDNNLIENAIRPTAVGRRRWLFIGHPQAGWRSEIGRAHV